MLVYVKQVLQTCEKQLDWAPAETPTKIAGLGNSRNIFSKIAELGSPYYHDYVDQGTILDRVVGSSRVRNIENISVPLELTCFFGSKTLRQSFISSSKIFNSSIKWFFFSIWTAKISLRSILACPISKKNHLISELKISLSELKLRLRVFLPQSKSIPEAKNI